MQNHEHESAIPDVHDATLTPTAVLHALRKNRALAATVALAVLLAAVFFTLGQKKIYRAESLLQIDPKPPSPLGNDVQGVVDIGTGNFWNNKEYYATQFAIITSKRVAIGVVQELGLDHNAAFLAEASPGATPPPQQVSVDEAAETLQDRIIATPVKDSRLVTVAYDDADPDRAQKILSTLVDTYVEQNLDYATNSTSSAVNWLRGQLKTLKTELENSEMSLHQYKQSHNILSVSIDDQTNILRTEIQKLDDMLTSVKAQKQEVAARKAELATISSTDPSNLPEQELLSSALLQQLRMTYLEAVRDRDALVSQGKGSQHPEVLAANARVKIAKDGLLQEVKNIKGAADNELRALGSQEAGLTKLLQASQKRALDVNLLEIQYDRLARTKDNNEKLYSMLLERTKESELTQMMRVNNIRVIDRPLPPRDPVKPRVPLNLVLGLVGGLALGVGASLGKEFLDRSVKSPDDVESRLGLAFLGMVPQIGSVAPSGKASGSRRGRRKRQRGHEPENLRDLELVVHRFPKSTVAEAARALRTNLLFMSPDNPYKTLAVTSAGPAEGKTTVASCIAIAMAQSGARVLLLDCDLRRPRLHRVFERDNDVGLTSALLDASALPRAINETEVPNLMVMTSGPLPPNPAELIHSDAFTRTLDSLRSQFDKIVIDTPPVMPVTDAVVLSTQVDATVLVVRTFKTSKDVVRRAARAMADVGGHLVGVVLNAIDVSRNHYGYADYYYYRRDGYYDQESASPSTTN